MLTNLQFKNFKSWQDTGPMRIASLTGFFGTNSSGKTAILHFLLMLKQTLESHDQQQVLRLEGPYTDLGVLADVMHKHTPSPLEFHLGFKPENIWSNVPGTNTRPDFDVLYIDVSVKSSSDNILVHNITYQFDHNNKNYSFGMQLVEKAQSNESDMDFGYRFISKNYKSRAKDIYETTFSARRKMNILFYDLIPYPRIGKFMAEISSSFDNMARKIRYLGPLREYPKRIYLQAVDRAEIGNRGENAIQLLLSEYIRGRRIQSSEQVAAWLKQLGLIYSFRINRIVPERHEFEVRIRLKENAPEVLLTEVGFGISQVLPILVLCASAPTGSTLIFEQPEIHLHPAVQSGLADIFIQTIKERKVQIILESHSEHLLRRLQRRVAEEVLDKDQAALYFCSLNDEGASQLTSLELDDYGNITNWPENFFGDDLGDLVAMTEAAIRRQTGGV